MRTIRRIFITGLVLLLPALVTIYLLGFTFNAIDSLLGNLFSTLGIEIPGLGFLVTIAAIFGVGLVATNVFGNKLLKLVEAKVANLPLIKPIYHSIRQIIVAFSGQRKNVFESVAMIEYPRKGLYAIGFITGQGAGEVQAKTDKDVITLFLPTTPNPTSGFLLLVPRDDITPLEMSVEEALKLIISAGVVIPQWPRPSESGGDDNNGNLRG